MSWFRKDPLPEGGDRRQKRHMFFRVLMGIWRFILEFIFWIVAVVSFGVATFIFAPEVTNWVDEKWPSFLDNKFGTDRSTIARLQDPHYFAEQTDIISEDKKQVACISSPVRRVVISEPGDIPALFRAAIIASEDKRFDSHKGVDMRDVFRALVMRSLGESTSGASTLTMQIAKDLRGGTGRRATWPEKIRDAITALRLERKFSKEQLMLIYVNTPYFGRGQYGIEAASQGYFGKPAKDLELHQVAFLVALISKPGLPFRATSDDPSALTPSDIRKANWHEMSTKTRRVLRRMREDGSISGIKEASAANAIDRTLQGEVLSRGVGCGANKYYVEYVRQELIRRGLRVDEGGLDVSVPRDEALEKVLEGAVVTTRDVYVSRHKDDADNDLLRAGAFAVDFTGNVLALVGNINFKDFKYDVMARGWRQPGSTFKIFTFGGLVEQITNQVLAEENPPQTLEDILAEVNKRCVVLDERVGVSLGRGRKTKWIQNFRSNNEPLYRGLIPCKLAVGESRNAAAIRAGNQAGIKNVIEVAYRLGMPKDPKHMLQPYPTTAIGGSEVNPLGMSGAAAFVNGGYRVTPHFINDVCRGGKSLLFKDDSGRARDCDALGEHRPEVERVIHPVVSAAMTDILRGPLDVSVFQKNKKGEMVEYFGGTARALRTGVIPGMDPLGPEVAKLSPAEKEKLILRFPVESAGEIAGKTGTATNADGKTSDAWLVLFVPGPESHPEKGIMLVFWMGKDSKDHPLGERGTGTNKGFAESGSRNWVHSAARVLKFLQEKRGLLQAGNKFRPIVKDEALLGFETLPLVVPPRSSGEDDARVVDPFDPATPPALLKQLPPPEPDEPDTPDGDAPPTLKD